MPKLTPPSLPPGPRQDLSTELHRLHLRAGRPSVRELSRALGQGVVSSSRIHDAFTKERVPAWALLDLLVPELARRVPRADPAEEVVRFHLLWQAAVEAFEQPTSDTHEQPTEPSSREEKEPDTSPAAEDSEYKQAVQRGRVFVEEFMKENNGILVRKPQSEHSTEEERPSAPHPADANESGATEADFEKIFARHRASRKSSRSE
ncbi:hypothetical protein ACFQ9J_35580 [Streptomyces sp. NPDC056529]|uniref:hypothetical protein n=1 Tax=Streptomyces sp. NPDC056529 TaxID=3345855 RepID=UPI0036B347D5